MRLNSTFLGKLECFAERELVAGLPNTLHFIYTAGRYGVDDGGSIRFARQGVTDWQPVQITDETQAGYTTVSTTGQVSVQLDLHCDGVRPYENVITVKVTDGCLCENDKIEVILGDRTHGSAGILTQTVAEQEHRVVLLVDLFGGNRFEEVSPACMLCIKNGSCADFHALLPSTVEAGEKFWLKLRVLDAYGNRCEDFEGNILLTCPPGLWCEENTLSLTAQNRGVCRVRCCAQSEGVYRVRAEMPYYGLSTVSNACKTVAQGAPRLYWGDMHGQNNMASGIGTMDDSLQFAKEMGALDFTGWQGNDFEISDENWRCVLEQLEQYNCDGEFITFSGYEWSGITSGGGDHNIYFRGGETPLHRSSQWLCKRTGKLLGYGKEDDGSDCYPVSELWEKHRGSNSMMAIPHIGGRHGNLDFYSPEHIRLIEIHSHHGIFEWFLREAVERGLRVGFIASSDDHTSRLGLSYPVGTSSGDFGATFDVKSGLTAVYTDALTREGLWDGLWRRCCYATTAARILLHFYVNGHPMGSEITACTAPEMTLEVHGTAPIDRVELYRGLTLLGRFYRAAPDETAAVKRVKIVWSGLRTKFRKKSVVWDGSIFVENGRITGAENYSVDRPHEGIVSRGNQELRFQSRTSGDEDGVVLDILPVPGRACTLSFASRQKCAEVKLEELTAEPLEIAVGEVDKTVAFCLDAPRADPADESAYDFTCSYIDEACVEGMQPYYAKVFQRDGNRAWTSPVFVEYRK